MSFIQLKTLIIGSELELVRADTKDYFEAVVLKEKLAGLIEKIDSAFGSQKLPLDKGFPAQVQAAIDNLGGIRGNQSLYVFNSENSFSIIMLWPWGDGKRVTLKMSKQ